MRVVANPPSDAIAPGSDSGARAVGRLRSLVSSQDARRGLLALSDQAVISGLSFATSLVIVHASGRSALGLVHLAMTLVYFMTNVQAELINAPYLVFRGRRSGANLHAYSGSAFVHQAALNVLAIVAIAVLLILCSLGLAPAALSASLWVLLVVAPVCLLHAFIRHFCFASFQFGVALTMDLAITILQLGSMLVLAGLNMLTVPLVFATMGVSAAVGCIGWWIGRREPLRFDKTRFVLHWRKNWLFARWTLASNLVGCAGIYILPWIIAVVHDEATTGTFVGCGKISALAATFVVGISHFLTPRSVSAFVDGGVSSLRRVLLATGGMYLVTVGGFCLVVWTAGDFLMVPLFGDDYAGTGIITTTLSLAVLMNSMTVVAGNGLWAINRPQANLLGDTVVLLTTMSIAIWLVGSNGVMGIAIASLAGAAAGAICRVLTLITLMKHVAKTESSRC